MGGNCQGTFGWYNVLDPASKTPPAAAEIYPFIDAPRDSLKCMDSDGITPNTSGFCPLAWDNRGPYDLSIVRWVPKSFSSGNLSNDPRYKGGYVAFALIGDPQKCPQNKYSMYEHNQRNSSGEPWVTSLIYQSRLDPSGVYKAFEDLPMSPADWKMGSNGRAGADGDFNDFVVYVSGVSCAGGNQACDTGQFGACAPGRTDCAVAGKPTVCRPTQQASAEICDDIDNDCDGVVDSGAGLCPDADKPVCFHGACVSSCKDGAFSCPVGLTCDDTGQCVDPTCALLSCKPGTACRNGVCLDTPCAGVVCPYGKQCELGRCVDPCAGVTCAGERVCEQGRCIGSVQLRRLRRRPELRQRRALRRRCLRRQELSERTNVSRGSVHRPMRGRGVSGEQPVRRWFLCLANVGRRWQQRQRRRVVLRWPFLGRGRDRRHR